MTTLQIVILVIYLIIGSAIAAIPKHDGAKFEMSSLWLVPGWGLVLGWELIVMFLMIFK